MSALADGSNATERSADDDTPHRRARSALTASCEAAEARLEQLRTQRDAMNDEIRLLVEEVTTMRSALGVFDRRASTEQEAARPRRRSGASS